MMTNELLTREDLQQFRMQLLSELKDVLQQSKQSTKQWLKSSEVRKMLGISHGNLQPQNHKESTIHETPWYYGL